MHFYILASLFCGLCAGDSLAVGQAPPLADGGLQGTPWSASDVVSLLQASLSVHEPKVELRDGATPSPGAAAPEPGVKEEQGVAEVALARLDVRDDATDHAVPGLRAIVLGNGSEPGGVSGAHRVPLDARKFGNVFHQVAGKCCLENATSVVQTRSHAVNRTRISEKLRMSRPGGENSSKYVDPEVKDEIGEMIVKVNKVLDVLMRAGHRGNHAHLSRKAHPGAHQRPKGFVKFFQSVEFFDWCLLSLFIVFFFALYSVLLRLPHRRLYHGLTLGVWLVMAVVFGTVIWLRQGEQSATLWVSGFILELIFLVENVFVFHIIINAFKLSHRVLDNALFAVVGFQVAFQVVFYMGLASVLTHWNVLPYILGVWLLYVGYHAAADDDHADFNVMESRVVRGCRWLLGSRLLIAYEPEKFVTVAKGKYVLTVGGLCMIFLVVADFLLEIDVTLAKIEGLGGAKIGPELEYICFSSSAVATFTVPELYFVARDTFARLRGLKYGIALVITYLGIQMLLGTVYTVPLLVDVAIFIGVLIASGITSVIVDHWQAVREAAGKSAGSWVDDLRSRRSTWNGVCRTSAQDPKAADGTAESRPSKQPCARTPPSAGAPPNEGSDAFTEASTETP